MLTLVAFTEYVVATAENKEFQRCDLNATYLDCALISVVKYMQSRCFGAAVNLLSRASPDDFEFFISRMNKNVNNPDDRWRANEL